MQYQWIEIKNLPALTSRDKVILFGAGEGTRQLLHYFNVVGPCPLIIALADNDPSMWHSAHQGIPIINPADIPDRMNIEPECRIIVTTVSGREAVAKQLSKMGLTEGVHFFNIGCYPSNAMTNLQTLLEANLKHGFLAPGSIVLHVGPGGFLGLECGLSALGYTVYSLDAFGFSMHYPAVTTVIEKYHEARKQFLALAHDLNYDLPTVKLAWEALFREQGDGILLNTSRITYLFPYNFQQLPFQSNSMDLIVSFDVLEHVPSPDQAINEIKRVLKPGGYCFHRIITRDHRSFSALAGYTPLSYAQYSPEEWEALNTDKFPQNRVLPFQWEAKFREKGFEVLQHTVLDHYDVPDEEYVKRHESFKSIPQNRMQEINCLQLLRKPESL